MQTIINIGWKSMKGLIFAAGCFFLFGLFVVAMDKATAKSETKITISEPVFVPVQKIATPPPVSGKVWILADTEDARKNCASGLVEGIQDSVRKLSDTEIQTVTESANKCMESLSEEELQEFFLHEHRKEDPPIKIKVWLEAILKAFGN